MFVFLSYAEADKEIAAQISAWLEQQAVDRFDYRANRSNRFLSQIESAIGRVDAFLVLLSPHFMQSSWCRQERDMALVREHAMQQDDPDRTFIHVLNVAALQPWQAGHLGTYSWLDFCTPDRNGSFDELARWLGLGQEADPPAPPGPMGGAAAAERLGSGPSAEVIPELPAFLNREDELDTVQQALSTTADRPFWLITSPPQLGKSWFLRQIRARLSEAGQPRWMTSMIDVRDIHPAVAGDPGALLAMFFGRDTLDADDQAALEDVAVGIASSGRPFLCLLDHAELLDQAVVARLRASLSQIHRIVSESNRRGVRLGVIVASRRDAEWLAMTSRPRVIKRSLSEFQPAVIEDALLRLAGRMEHNYTQPEARGHSEIIHELTQGLPALLTVCLAWIQSRYWIGMEQLRQQQLFDQLARPYILSELLNIDSLLPRGCVAVAQGTEPEQALAAIREAYRVLVPFRLFTRSHLHYYMDADTEFRMAVAKPTWSPEDLWGAVSETALLTQLVELWKEIHPAVRRLLHRFYYDTDELRIKAHTEARKFVEVWASQQNGTEQVTCLIECLWHEAMSLRTRPGNEMAAELLGSAGLLSRQLRESTAYRVSDLRGSAVRRMGEDEELQQAVNRVPGLFDRLMETVLNPPAGDSE